MVRRIIKMDPDSLDLYKETVDHFKDWSNFLLVTTVAMLAWIAEGKTNLAEPARKFCLIAFALSICFAIFTLAMIPLVTEKLAKDVSIYEVKVSFRWVYVFDWSKSEGWTLKYACWLQHVFFLLGIIVFTGGSLRVTKDDGRVAVRKKIKPSE
jgi:hypothetical protein